MDKKKIIQQVKKHEEVLRNVGTDLSLSENTLKLKNSSGAEIGIGVTLPKGEKGEDGVTPNITVGTVATLEAGQQATVVKGGTTENPIFDFGIPKGEKGDKGESGEQGRDGVDGQDGKSVELQKTTTHIQWRQEDGVWQDLIALADLKGEKGDNAIVDLTDYATQAWVLDQIANIQGGGSVDLSSYYTKNEVDTKLETYATKVELHSHTNKTTLDGITEAKITEWDNKSEFNGDYNDLTNKPIIPSIEGLATETFVTNKIAEASLGGGEVDLSGYATKAELNNKANKNHTHSAEEVTFLDGQTFQEKLNSGTLTGPKGEKGDKGEAIVIEDNLVQINANENMLSLTTDKFQLATLKQDTTITLPNVSKFTQIHLFFTTSDDLTLIFPSIRWQSQPNIVANKVYELILTYTTEWLGGIVQYE